jgi:transcriptional regulator with XRE-family HTH domain
MQGKASIQNWYSESDQSIVETIGRYIHQVRLSQNISQGELAVKAGVSRITVAMCESGKKAVTLTTLIQLLRALRSLEVLYSFEYHESISPIALADRESQKRKRAGRKSVAKLKAIKSTW